jgi:phage-related protein
MADRSWTVEYYETGDGASVVEEELQALGPKIFARILRTVDLLEDFGLALGGDYVGHVRDKIWELRVSRYRVLYFASTGRRFVLLHAFTKKTQKTPEKDINMAQRRLEDYVARAAVVRSTKGAPNSH